MGYTTSYPPLALNRSGTAAWAYDTQEAKVAGEFHRWDFLISQNVFPIGTVSFAFDAYTSGAVGNSVYIFYRNGVSQANGQLTGGWITYTWSQGYTDLKVGDVFSFYIAESIGGGGSTYMRNRRMYIMESLFQITDSGS